MIELLGMSLPCPVNRLWRTHGHGVRLSKEAREKMHRFVGEVHERLGGPPTPYTYPCQVTISWTPRDKRIADCDAYVKAVLDGLTKAGVYVDDNLVVDIHISRAKKPVFPGSMDITVWEIPEPDEVLRV